MFMGLAMNQDYFKKNLNVFVALAPIANLGDTTSKTFRLLSDGTSIFEDAINLFGMYQMFPPNYNHLSASFCNYIPSICKGIISMIADMDPSVDNFSRIKSYLGHTPSGTGYRNMIHYA